MGWRGLEERHGFAGTLRRLGGWGAISGPMGWRGLEERHGFAGTLRMLGTSYGVVKHFRDASGRLPQMLSRHRRQVMGLVIGDLAAPQHEDDLEPLRRERAERVVMAVAAAAAAVVIGARPLACLERLQGELVHGVAQVGVAGEPEQHGHVLAAAVGHGDDAGVALEMAKGLPAPGGVAQLSV